MFSLFEYCLLVGSTVPKCVCVLLNENSELHVIAEDRTPLLQPAVTSSSNLSSVLTSPIARQPLDKDVQVVNEASDINNSTTCRALNVSMWNNWWNSALSVFSNRNSSTVVGSDVLISDLNATFRAQNFCTLNKNEEYFDLNLSSNIFMLDSDFIHLSSDSINPLPKSFLVKMSRILCPSEREAEEKKAMQIKEKSNMPVNDLQSIGNEEKRELVIRIVLVSQNDEMLPKISIRPGHVLVGGLLRQQENIVQGDYIHITTAPSMCHVRCVTMIPYETLVCYKYCNLST